MTDTNDIHAPLVAGESESKGGDGSLEKRLRELFALTPAEARVAVALFEGATPRETADAFGISFNTVHVHLARIFRKTGTNRQSHLMRAMMRAVGASLG